MNIKQKFLLLLTLGTAAQAYGVANAEDSRRCTEQTVTMTTTVDGCSQTSTCTRKAFVCLPTAWWDYQTQTANIPSNSSAPVVLAFHGRGTIDFTKRTDIPLYVQNYIQGAPEAGTFAVDTNLHGEMPGAIVIYFQGLPTDGNWTASEDFNNPRGWQVNIETSPNSNRDIKFVEKFLTTSISITGTPLTLKNVINKSEVFAVGHSNGSRFVGVLWNHSSTESPLQRSNLKAVAFSAAQAGDFPVQVNGASGADLFDQADPVSIFMGMGELDTVVKFDIQVQSIAKAQALLATGSGTTIPTTSLENLQVFDGANGLKLVTYLHKFPGPKGDGHVWPVNQEKKIAQVFGLQP